MVRDRAQGFPRKIRSFSQLKAVAITIAAGVPRYVSVVSQLHQSGYQALAKALRTAKDVGMSYYFRGAF